MLSLMILMLFFLIVNGEELPEAHLKPFGWGNAIPFEEVDGFLDVKTFFSSEYLALVRTSSNLLLVGDQFLHVHVDSCH